MVAIMRFLPMAMLVLAACAEDDYSRPKTLEYLTEAVLIPSCAQAQCHSTFKQAEELSFSTIEEARVSVHELVGGAVTSPTRGEPDDASLVIVLTRSIDRMPYDQPLANADIQYIRDFVEIGAPGAQCNPAFGDRQCLKNAVYTCGADFNYGELIDDCRDNVPGQICSAGECVDR